MLHGRLPAVIISITPAEILHLLTPAAVTPHANHCYLPADARYSATYYKAQFPLNSRRDGA
jgi:hypothetical protein